MTAASSAQPTTIRLIGGPPVLDGSVWDLADGKVVRRFTVKSKRARGGAILPDRRHLLTGDSQGMLQLWDIGTGQEVKQIQMAGPWMIDSLILTPDGRQALVACVAGVRLYDLETGEEVRQFQENHEEDHQAALSPDGRWLLAGSFDGGVRLWDFQSGDLLRVLGRHNEFVFSVAFSPDGRLAASGGGGINNGGNFVAGSDHDIRLWDMTTVPAQVASAQKSARKGWLAAAGLLVLVVGLSGFGVWYYVHQSRRPRKTAEHPPAKDQRAAASPRVAVQCPGCGQNLKVKTQLAGKRVQCPQCGQAVVVPATKAAEEAALPDGSQQA